MERHDLTVFNDEKTLDFLCTVNEDGTPHITVFNSVLRYDDDTLMFGEYCRGLSKSNLLRNPKASIFAIDSHGVFTSGTLLWKERRNTGPEHELFNNIPRFRYNATYGYEYVHLLTIRGLDAPKSLDAGVREDAGRRTKQAIATLPTRIGGEVLTYVGRSLFEPEDGPKVLAFIADDGYPRALYIPQARLAGAGRAVIGEGPSSDAIKLIPPGADVTIMAFSPRVASSITVKGKLAQKKLGETDAYVLDIERVYNGNTPKAGYIYPRSPVTPIRKFRGAADV